jgi:Cu2+-exporting ATPase
MTCCAPGLEGAAEIDRAAIPSREEILLASRKAADGVQQIDLAVPGVHCAACIRTIEQALSALPGVVSARVNLSTKRVGLRWKAEMEPPPAFETLERLGYPAHLFDFSGEGRDEVLAELIRAVAVSGFAASNIMLLSVSVWSGADAATRDLFHWLSALIAIPALVFAGRIYFRSAWRALSHGRMNMDVPIAIGVSLAYAMSLYETITHGPHAYFDACVSLLFFLLIGRTLDHLMRERARVAVSGLRRLAARGATVLRPDGSRDFLPVEEIEVGDAVMLAPGDRVPVDAVVREGRSEIDCSLVSGESAPQAAGPGARLAAGTMNLTGPLVAVALRPASDSFLAEMMRLMEAAEGGRARYRRIADRASSLYSPVVHLTAFLTFLGWMAVSGDWHRALTIAIAVLIITCPCALGLAVPIVQVVAARRLFENGIMVREGSAMERLADVDTIVFDKTGTLTLGTPVLTNAGDIDPALLAVAGSLAGRSRHPAARAIADAASGLSADVGFAVLREVPGLGIEAEREGAVWRLGRAEWACEGTPGATGAVGPVLSRDGKFLAAFACEDRLRPEAARTVAVLKADGMAVEMLSGDREMTARSVAAEVGIDAVQAGVLPADKQARIAALAEGGRRVLMVGDGLNDAPALAAAHASMAPATAADVGRNAADFVFLRSSLTAVPLAIEVSRKAGRLIRQNLAFAIGYNVVAVPIAILGHVTPLVAAIAMSTSSIVVIANALRLTVPRRGAAAPLPRKAPGLREAAA